MPCMPTAMAERPAYMQMHVSGSSFFISSSASCMQARTCMNVRGRAVHACMQVLPVYVWDPTFFAPAAKSRGGDSTTPRTGAHRARFMMESVEALRQVL